MPNEIFRFVLTRPVQRVSSTRSRAAIAPYARIGESPFIRAIRSAENADEVRRLALARLESSDAALAKDAHLQRLAESDRKLPREELHRLIGELADNVVAGMLAGTSGARRAPERMRMLREAEIAARAQEVGNLPAAEIKRIERARILLPALRLAVDAPPADADPAPAPAAPALSSAPTVRELEAAAQELRGLRRTRAFEDEHARSEDDGFTPRGLFGGGGAGNAGAAAKARHTWQAEVSDATRRILAAGAVPMASMELEEAVHAVESLASRRLAPRPDPLARTRAQKLGSAIGTVRFASDGKRDGWFGPGPGDDDAAGLDATPTIPETLGNLRRKRRGDLYIVRQTLARYELGEIAHIENVLKGESNSRTFKRSQTSEDTIMTATETAITEENDLQSTERFELSAESREAIEDNLKLEAGFSVTASYGPTVGVEAGTNFAYEHAQEKSQETASNYAREVTNRAQSKLESRLSEQRTSRLLREVEEITEHGIDNTVGAGHVQGIYRWVDKVYEAQLVNYGIRDLYDFYVPEPAAFFRHARANLEVEGVSVDAPSLPMVGNRPLQPSDLEREQYHEWVALYGVADATPPPPPTINVAGMLEKGAAQGDDAAAPGSKVSTELMVPEGYVTTRIKVNGYGHYTQESHNWAVVIGGRQFTRSVDGDSKEFGGRRDKLPAALVHYGYDALSVGISLSCECQPVHFEQWQLKTFSAIMQGYQRLKSQYDEQVGRARDAVSASIHGRSPQANEKVMRDELKRAVISIMTGQRFERFDAMRPAAAPHGYPEIAFADAAAEGGYVAFTEQAFEWENMTFLFYPYFWGRKSGWPQVSQLEDNDYLFEQFLKAGFARVQVPVRPGFESRVDFAFDPSNPNGHVWPGEDPPGFESDGLAIEEEMRFQTGGANFVRGPGFVTVTAGSDVIAGRGTEFTDDDVDRELRVGRDTYRIVTVIDAAQVRVAAPTPAVAAADSVYGLGAKLAGLPWEIKVPTTLVYLQPDARLNP